MKRFGAVAMAAGLITLLLSGVALALPTGDTATLVVDGTSYTSYKKSGSAYHFNTPDVNPQSAYVVDGHTWTGNGSEHLPCEFGIHWIHNKNVLTVSHCLDGPDETTTTTTLVTTTTVPETTTTVPETTTTTVVITTTTVPVTSTTISTSSTTVVETTTTVPGDTTTSTVPTECQDDPSTDENECELPFTGPAGLAWFGVFAGLFLVLGGATLYATETQ